MIANFSEYDLVITYSWGHNDHGICGHTFEAIEYYWILKHHFKCALFFAEEIDVDFLLKSKYNFTEGEREELLKDTYFIHKPKLIVAKNILFTDGGMHKLKHIVVKANNKIAFTCSNFELAGYTVLNDNRIYSKQDYNYKKKILFDKLKTISTEQNKTLLYATNNCRAITDTMYKDLTTRDEEFLCLVNQVPRESYTNIEFKVVPIDNIFEQFNKYMYTPVPRQFDCSPRFLAECRWYGKEIEFYNIDYWEKDLGLKYRWYDIENDFKSIELTIQDEIVDIIKDIIC